MKSRRKNKKNKKGESNEGDDNDINGRAAPPSSSNIKTEYTLKAEEEFARGDWNAAINSFNRAIALANQKPQVLAQLTLGRAKARWFSKDFPQVLAYRSTDHLSLMQAIADATSAASMEPSLAAAHLWRANGHLKLDQYQDAIEHYNIALRLYGEGHAMVTGVKEAMRHAADAKAQPKDAKKVLDIDWFKAKGLLDEEAVKNNAGEDLPLLNPVGEYAGLDTTSADLADPHKRAERAVKEKEAGNLDFAGGQYISALVHYSNAIKIQPREPVFYSNRALVYLKLNRFAEAITDCTASIDRKPSIKAFARRGAAWTALNQYVLAAEDYKRALRFEARNADCLQELQRCLTAIEEDCKRQISEQPQNENARRLLKRAKDDYKMYIVQAALSPEAPQQGSAMNSTAPSHALAPMSAASAHMSNATTPTPGPSSAATSSANSALPTKNVHAERELLDEIIEFSKRLETDGTDSQAFLGRARLYLKRNELDKAIADFKFGLRIDPDNKELQQGLRQAISIKTKEMQDRQAAAAAALAAQALAQPTTVSAQTPFTFDSEPATDAIPAEAPTSATCPPTLMAAGPLPERPEPPRAVGNGTVTNSSGLGAGNTGSSVPASAGHAAAAAVNALAADTELSEDSEYDDGDDEGDFDVESDAESDDSSPPKPMPPGHKQP